MNKSKLRIQSKRPRNWSSGKLSLGSLEGKHKGRLAQVLGINAVVWCPWEDRLSFKGLGMEHRNHNDTEVMSGEGFFFPDARIKV